MMKKTCLLSAAIAVAVTANTYSPEIFAGALSESQTSNSWYTDSQSKLTEKLARTQNQAAKNVILFVGDGMGISTLTASRILEGQLENKPGEEGYLSFERFPYTALAKTYNVDYIVGGVSKDGVAEVNEVPVVEE